MEVEGYQLIANCAGAVEITVHAVMNHYRTKSDLDVIIGNEAMWYYMTTGQVLEGQINGRTDTRRADNKEGTDQ